jgi:hypothetical protein
LFPVSSLFPGHLLVPFSIPLLKHFYHSVHDLEQFHTNALSCFLYFVLRKGTLLKRKKEKILFCPMLTEQSLFPTTVLYSTDPIPFRNSFIF